MTSDQCCRGHAFTEANTYARANGKRECKQCRALLMQQRRKGIAAPPPLPKPAKPRPVPKRMTTAERFWSMVVTGEDGHWLWTGPVAQGHGKFSFTRERGRSTSTTAQRFAWELEHDQRLEANMQLYPACGRWDCVNPRHRVALGRQDFRERAEADRARR